MKKSIPALLAAALITLVLGGGMFLVGQDAQAASAASQVAVSADSQYAATIQVLQAQVAQYQAMEQQYQQQLTQAAERINTANQQIEQANLQLAQYQTLLTQLQDSGLIVINSDGTINLVTQQAGFSGWRPEGGHH